MLTGRRASGPFPVRKDGLFFTSFTGYMPLNKNPEVSVGSSKKLPLLPPDTYQVEILDITEHEGTKYQSSEVEMQVKFKVALLDEGPNYGRFLTLTCSPKMVGGAKPSNLHQVVTAAIGRAFTSEEMKDIKNVVTMDFLNSLIGSQMRVSVISKARQDGQGETNKVVAYMPKKSDFPAYDEAKAKAAYAAIEG